MPADLARRLAVARGDEPADLVVRGGRVLSVFTREWLEADVAIVDGWIAGLGRYEGRDELDAGGRRVVPRVLPPPKPLQASEPPPPAVPPPGLPLRTTTGLAHPPPIPKQPRTA